MNVSTKRFAANTKSSIAVEVCSYSFPLDVIYVIPALETSDSKLIVRN